MLLFEIKYGKIGVYSLKPQKNKIKDYKRYKMSQIDPWFRVFEATEYVTPPNSPLLVTTPSKSENYISSKQFENITLTPCENHNRSVQILNDYYEGRFTDPNQPYSTIKVEINNSYRYFLIGWQEKEKDNGKPYNHYVPKLILLPKSLYLLDAIEQRKFGLVKDEDISEQLTLFNPEKKYEIEISDSLTKSSKKLEKGFYRQLATDYSEDRYILKHMLN